TGNYGTMVTKKKGAIAIQRLPPLSYLQDQLNSGKVSTLVSALNQLVHVLVAQALRTTASSPDTSNANRSVRRIINGLTQDSLGWVTVHLVSMKAIAIRTSGFKKIPLWLRDSALL